MKIKYIVIVCLTIISLLLLFYPYNLKKQIKEKFNNENISNISNISNKNDNSLDILNEFKKKVTDKIKKSNLITEDILKTLEIPEKNQVENFIDTLH